MIWLAEHIAALVVIIVGGQVLFHLLRNWWQSQAWLRRAAAYVLPVAASVLIALIWLFRVALVLICLCTPVGWMVLLSKWRKVLISLSWQYNWRKVVRAFSWQ
jgi:hypothetical protein